MIEKSVQVLTGNVAKLYKNIFEYSFVSEHSKHFLYVWGKRTLRIFIADRVSHVDIKQAFPLRMQVFLSCSLYGVRTKN